MAPISCRRTSLKPTTTPSRRSAVHLANTISGAPFVYISDLPSAVCKTTDIAFRSESKGISYSNRDDGEFPSMPPFIATTSNAPSVGSPTTSQPARPLLEGVTRALLQRAAIVSASSRSGSAAGAIAVAVPFFTNSPCGA